MTHRTLAPCVSLVLILGGGCASESHRHNEPAPTLQHDPTQMHEARNETRASEWLGRVREAHAFVDAALATGRIDDARRRLDELSKMTVSGAPEDRVVQMLRRDLFARLAEVELLKHAPAQALLATQAGLALGDHADALTAELRFWKARAHEALGDTKAAEREFALCRAAAEATSVAPR